MANTFLDMGVSKGDRVILFLPKSLGFVVAHIALQKIGAIGVPVNPGFKQSEMRYLLEDTEAILVISGSEQEAVINQVEGVAESSVVGIPDEKWGEKVVTAVVTKPGTSVKPHEIQTFCKEHLHNWKVPKDVVFLKELPKNKMGKVLKEEVKKVFHH